MADAPLPAPDADAPAAGVPPSTPPDDAPQVEAADTSAPVADPPERTCPNCGAVGRGAYCADCGQRHRDARLTLRGLWADFASRAFSLDAGLLLTVRRLAGGPGRVPAEYVDGLRQRYTHPLSFYLLTAAVYLFSFGLFQETIIRALGEEGASIVQIEVGEETRGAPREALSTGERVARSIAELDGDDGTGVLRRLTQIQRRVTTPLLVFFALFLVGPLRLAFGPRRNLAETAIFTLYVVGAGTLALALLAPLLFLALPLRAAAFAQSGVAFAVYPGLVAWGAAAFWRPGWATVLKAVVAALVGLAVYTLASGLVSVVLLFGEILDGAGLTWRDLLRS